MPKPLTVAAIDAGSNAIRVIVAHALPEGLRTLAAERVSVRLGKGTFTTGSLSPQTIDNAVAAFSRFRHIFDEHEVDIYRAVATSALRSADNREQLLDRIYREAGISLEVIDGLEEGRLVRKAVLSRFPDRRPPAAIADLGGGSLEVMTRKGGDWSANSVKIGTVRMLETFGLRGAISEDEQRMIQRFIRSTLRAGLSPEVQSAAIKSAAGCGGNFETLAELFGERNKSGVLQLPIDALKQNLSSVVRSDVKERMSRFKVRKDRAEVMGVAAIVLNTLGKEMDLERYVVPEVGIRDGILLDLAEASLGQLGISNEAPAIASARVFAERVGYHLRHGEQVRMIASRLFEELQSVHKLPKKCSTILQLAALLHDVGEVVHRKSHHKHGEYLILNGRIPGLESPEREMVAATVRGHRKSLPSEKKHQTFSSLEPRQRNQVTKMTTLLRLADTLDQQRRGEVVALSAQIKSKKVTLQVSTRAEGAPVPEYIANYCKDFEDVFGSKLEVEMRQVAPKQRAHRRTTEAHASN